MLKEEIISTTARYTVNASQRMTTSTQALEFKSFYKTASGNEGNKCDYSTCLDPYGCECFHDCFYCYVKSLLNFRGLWHLDNPSVSRTDKIEGKIYKLERGTIVCSGGMIDCSQPCEAVYRGTYRATQSLNRQGVRCPIVTKSSVVADDKYIRLTGRKPAYIRIPATSTGDTFSRTSEKACLSSVRIKAIEKLQEQGFDVPVRLSPSIPQFTGFKVLNSIKCDKALVEFLWVNAWVKQWFDIDYSEHTPKRVGYNHLQLE